MDSQHESDTLGIVDDLKFQRRTWIVQRIGWAMMILLSFAALLGVFGKGPLSNAHLGDDGSTLRADYDRFLRLNAPTELTVYIGAAAIKPDSTAELWVDRSWLSNLEISQITPEPDKTRALADRLVYTFRVQPGSAPARVTFSMNTRSLWKLEGRIGVAGGPSYSFSQFAYP